MNHLFYQSDLWINLSLTIKIMYGRECMKCGTRKGQMHTDHIVPRSKNISRELDPNNLQVLCKKCNESKSNKNSIDYRNSHHKELLRLYLISNSYQEISVDKKTRTVKKKIVAKKLNRNTVYKHKLTPRDIALQKRYDALKNK